MCSALMYRIFTAASSWIPKYTENIYPFVVYLVRCVLATMHANTNNLRSRFTTGKRQSSWCNVCLRWVIGLLYLQRAGVLERRTPCISLSHVHTHTLTHRLTLWPRPRECNSVSHARRQQRPFEWEAKRIETWRCVSNVPTREIKKNLKKKFLIADRILRNESPRSRARAPNKQHVYLLPNFLYSNDFSLIRWFDSYVCCRKKIKQKSTKW